MSSDGTFELDLRLLLALRAVAEHQSFGRAAAALGYTQSAISQQIATLEKVVGEPVFDRPGGPKPVQLTRAGELLLVHAESILDRVRAAEADLASYRAGRLGRLVVGTFQSVSVRILPEVLRRLRAERPDLEIGLVETDDQDELLRLLTTGELDLTFMEGPTPDGDFELLAFGDDPYILLSPAAETLAPEHQPVPMARLNELPIIGQTPSSCSLRIERAMRQSGVDAHVVFRSGDNSAVQAMVRAGVGHAVMPLLAVDLSDPGVVVRRLDPPIPSRQIGIALPTRRHRAAAVDVVVEVARAVCTQLMAPAGDLVA